MEFHGVPWNSHGVILHGQATQLNEARNSTHRKLLVLVPEPPVYWTSIRQADADPSLTGFSFSYDYL